MAIVPSSTGLEKNTLIDCLETRPLIAKNLSSDELAHGIVNVISQQYKKGLYVAVLQGAPGSGKTTLAKELVRILNDQGYHVDTLATDDFNKGSRLTRDLAIENGADPRDFKDFTLLEKIVDDIRAGKDVYAPQYEGIVGNAIDRGILPHRLNSQLQILIIEGDFSPLPIDKRNLSIYLHVDSDTRKENRIYRDMEKRGATDATIVAASFDRRQLSQFFTITLPTMRESDILIDTHTQRVENGRRRFLYAHDVYAQG